MKYTQDPRYQIFHNESNDTWTLKVKQWIFNWWNERNVIIHFLYLRSTKIKNHQIKQVKKEDEGYFECQISTAQPIGMTIYLKISGKTETAFWEKFAFNYVPSFTWKDPELAILDAEDDRFVQAGSNLNLTCSIEQMLSEKKVLRWTHNDQVRTYYCKFDLIEFFFAWVHSATFSDFKIKYYTLSHLRPRVWAASY